MNFEWIILFYGFLKLVFYLFWISKIPPDPLPIKSVFKFGLFRLFLGIILGWLAGFIGIVVTLGVVSSTHKWGFIFTPLYLIYIPIRYLEWGLMAYIIRKKIWNKELQIWIFLGIGVSYLCDILMHLIAIIFHWEVGRIFC